MRGLNHQTSVRQVSSFSSPRTLLHRSLPRKKDDDPSSSAPTRQLLPGFSKASFEPHYQRLSRKKKKALDFLDRNDPMQRQGKRRKKKEGMKTRRKRRRERASLSKYLSLMGFFFVLGVWHPLPLLSVPAAICTSFENFLLLVIQDIYQKMSSFFVSPQSFEKKKEG